MSEKFGMNNGGEREEGRVGEGGGGPVTVGGGGEGGGGLPRASPHWRA